PAIDVAVVDRSNEVVELLSNDKAVGVDATGECSLVEKRSSELLRDAGIGVDCSWVTGEAAWLLQLLELDWLVGTIAVGVAIDLEPTRLVAGCAAMVTC